MLRPSLRDVDRDVPSLTSGDAALLRTLLRSAPPPAPPTSSVLDLFGLISAALLQLAVVIYALIVCTLGVLLAVGLVTGIRSVRQVKGVFILAGLSLALVLSVVRLIVARRPRSPDAVSVDRDDEPRLFAVLAAIAEMVGVPAPRRVEIDTGLDARWSPRRDGAALTLGATGMLATRAGPWLADVAARLAERRGGVVPRLRRVLRGIAAWMLAALVGPDRLDAAIERRFRVTGRTAWWASLVTTWSHVTRLVFIPASWCARASTSLLERQQELDRARVIGAFFGAPTLAALLRTHAELARAFERCERSLNEAAAAGRHPSDLPEVIVAEWRDHHHEIAEQCLAEEAAMPERRWRAARRPSALIAAAQALDGSDLAPRADAAGPTPSIDACGARFLRQARATCREATARFSERQLRAGTTSVAEEVEHFQHRHRGDEQAIGAVRALFRVVPFDELLRVPPWPDEERAASTPPSEARQRIRDALLRHREAVQTHGAAYLLHQGLLRERWQARVVLQTIEWGYAPPKAHVAVPRTRRKLKPFLDALEARIADAAPEASRIDEAVFERLAASIDFLAMMTHEADAHDDQVAPIDPRAPATAYLAIRATGVLAALVPAKDRLLMRAQALALAQRGAVSGGIHLRSPVKRFKAETTALTREAEEFDALLAATPDPFGRRAASTSLAELLGVPRDGGSIDPEVTMTYVEEAGELVSRDSWRSVGRLAAVVLHVEHVVTEAAGEPPPIDFTWSEPLDGSSR